MAIKVLILPSFFASFHFFLLSHLYITHMDIFHQSFRRNYLTKDFEIFDNFVFSLKVLQPLIATAGVCELCSLLAIFIFILRSLVIPHSYFMQLIIPFAVLVYLCGVSLLLALVEGLASKPSVGSTDVRIKTAVLLLSIHYLLLLTLFMGFMVDPCFVMQYLVYILVLQSPR